MSEHDPSYEADVWNGIFAQREWGKYPDLHVVRFIARSFFREPDRSRVRILEIGCGTGANLWFLAREGFGTYGLDGAAHAVEKAKARLDEECPGWHGKVMVGDARDLPFENDSFDAVIDMEAISCNSFEDSRKIYSETARVLKPGGKMFSCCFAPHMTGYATGEKVGHEMWVVEEGPLKGLGAVRFTPEEDIPALCGDFIIDALDHSETTQFNKRIIVKENIIIATVRK